MREFETENFGVERDGRFGVFAAERGVMQLFAEHGILPDLASLASLNWLP
jgi:hypothetical protein